jgi:AhpD family alkylhydroperoxidase
MARVELLRAEQAPLVTKMLFGEGDPGPIVASLATVPELLTATLPFVAAALGPSAVDARRKEMAILRTSAVLRCRYCVDAHTPVALDVGLSLEEVRALRCEAPLDCFTDPADRALVDWITAVAGGRGAVPEPTAAAVLAHLPEHEMVELTVTIGATMFLNRYCTALELPTSDDTLLRLTAEGFA